MSKTPSLPRRGDRARPRQRQNGRCVFQPDLCHEHQRGVAAGYAKFETFPVWNLPQQHPVNLAYEAATLDLDDVNVIDPYPFGGA